MDTLGRPGGTVAKCPELGNARLRREVLTNMTPKQLSSDRYTRFFLHRNSVTRRRDGTLLEGEPQQCATRTPRV